MSRFERRRGKVSTGGKDSTLLNLLCIAAQESDSTSSIHHAQYDRRVVDVFDLLSEQRRGRPDDIEYPAVTKVDIFFRIDDPDRDALFLDERQELPVARQVILHAGHQNVSHAVAAQDIGECEDVVELRVS